MLKRPRKLSVITWPWKHYREAAIATYSFKRNCFTVSRTRSGNGDAGSVQSVPSSAADGRNGILPGQERKPSAVTYSSPSRPCFQPPRNEKTYSATRRIICIKSSSASSGAQEEEEKEEIKEKATQRPRRFGLFRQFRQQRISGCQNYGGSSRPSTKSRRSKKTDFPAVRPADSQQDGPRRSRFPRSVSALKNSAGGRSVSCDGHLDAEAKDNQSCVRRFVKVS